MRRLLGRRLPGTAAALLLGLTGCAAGQPTTAGTVPSPVPPSPTVTITHGERHSLIDQPPPFRIRYGGTELHLNPVTYCYRSGCVDGRDPNPPDVGSPEELFVYVPNFPEFRVEQIGGGDYCNGRRVPADVTQLGHGWWWVRPRGPAGEYVMSLSASGGGGDMVADVRWTTPADRPLPEPSARLALIVDHDGRPDSYGLELSVTDLPATPSHYSATITVTASNGQSMTFDAAQSAETCAGEGAIFFDEPDAQARQAAQLGDFPFTTTVELTLDGVTYVATATYPDDEIAGEEPHVALEFDPPLPR
jgi:hypothetical protein